MCRIIFSSESQAVPSFASAKTSTRDAIDYVNLLVNGNFETCVKTASVADKVSTCLSVICALVKEFNLDWLAENVASRSIKDQKDYLAALGAYLDLPLRTLSQIMKRLRYVGRRNGALTFQQNVLEYFEVINLGDKAALTTARPSVLLMAYLATALEAHRQWCYHHSPVDCLPWTLHVNRKGTRIFVRYSYWKRNSRSADARLIKSRMDYVIPCDLPAITADGMRSLSSMYK